MTRSVECLSCLARDWLRSEKNNNSNPSGFRQGGTPGADGQPAQTIITRGLLVEKSQRGFPTKEIFRFLRDIHQKWLPHDQEIQGSTQAADSEGPLQLFFRPKTNLASAKRVLVALMLQRGHSIIVAPSTLSSKDKSGFCKVDAGCTGASEGPPPPLSSFEPTPQT